MICWFIFPFHLKGKNNESSATLSPAPTSHQDWFLRLLSTLFFVTGSRDVDVYFSHDVSHHMDTLTRSEKLQSRINDTLQIIID